MSGILVTVPLNLTTAMERFSVDEKCDSKTVDKIVEQTAYNRHQNIRLDGRYIFITDCLHICHRVWCRAHTKTAHSGRKHSRIIVASHNIECNKIIDSFTTMVEPIIEKNTNFAKKYKLRRRIPQPPTPQTHER